MTKTFAFAFGILGTSLVGSFAAIADSRADYWEPVFDDLAQRSGTEPPKRLSVLPFKGCGWSIGETIYGETTIGGAPAEFTMCRSRHGVRFDLTIHGSRWIRGGKR